MDRRADGSRGIRSEHRRRHDSTVLRILLSLLSYLEVLEFGLSSARAQALAAEALTEDLVAAVEAQLRPVAAVEQGAQGNDQGPERGRGSSSRSGTTGSATRTLAWD